MLPEIELDRIKSTYTTNDTRANYVAKSEASIWYERMGKFAEWVSDESYSYNTEGKHWWDRYNNIMTTPELITEFLNQLNEGK